MNKSEGLLRHLTYIARTAAPHLDEEVVRAMVAAVIAEQERHPVFVPKPVNV